MKRTLYILAVLIVVAAGYTFLNPKNKEKSTIKEKFESQGGYTINELVTDLDRPWGIAFLPSGEILFSQRINKISLIVENGIVDLNPPTDTYVNGEGGMMGVAVDPDFDTNSFVYACFNSKVDEKEPEIIVARFALNLEEMSLVDRKDIVSGIPANTSGRHSGCQIEFGPDGYLWVGTGDTAQQPVPQDPKSLGGKILRVDREGNPADGNLNEPFDSRIFSYGHRNTQGLGFFLNESHKNLVGISIEHGPNTDDEVNFLTQGNFGWDPLPYYGEDVPMTDKEKYPDAVEALWESGYPTIAAAGGTVINSEKWKEWQNSIAVAALKGSHIRILSLDPTGNITKEEEILKNSYGRFRTIRESPDGILYLLTDNGKGDDLIITLEPR